MLSVSFLNYEHEPVDGENENILKLFVLHLLLPAIKLYLNGNKKSLIKILDLIMQAHWWGAVHGFITLFEELIRAGVITSCALGKTLMTEYINGSYLNIKVCILWGSKKEIGRVFIK